VEGRTPVVCTRCGQEAALGESFCRGCGAFLEWTGKPMTPVRAPDVSSPAPRGDSRPGPVPAGPAVVATLRARSLKVDPGAQASLDIEILNRGKIVDQLAAQVLGPVAGWSTVIPPRLNLLPGTSGTVTIAFCPPRTPGVHAGTHLASIVIGSREHPDESVTERVGVEVAPFSDVDASMTPSVLRGSVEARAAVSVTNRGNAALDAVLSAEDPELAFAFRLSATRIRIDPGQTSSADVAVIPRETLRAMPSQTRPFRVLVTAGEGWRRTLEGTFVQVPVAAAPQPTGPATRQPAAAPPPTVVLSAPVVRVEPGGRVSVTVSVLNRGGTVDGVALRIDGAAAAWSTLEPVRLDVPPGAWATATVTCRPDRSPSLRPGRYDLVVGVRTRQSPATPITERLDVEVMPFVALETELTPTTVRGAQPATVRVANRGNAPAELSLSGEDPASALVCRFSPAVLRVPAGSTSTSSLSVALRTAARADAPGPQPFRVVLTAGDGSRTAVAGSFEPTPRSPVRPVTAVILLAPTLAVVLVVGFMVGEFLYSDLRAQNLALPAALVIWVGGLVAALRNAARMAGGVGRFSRALVSVVVATVLLLWGLSVAILAMNQG
jgi:hypothetical protein